MTYYTTKGAAAELGLAVDSVRAYVRKYEIGTRFGRDWMISDKGLAIIRWHMKRGPGKPKNRRDIDICPTM